MRELADRERIESALGALGREADSGTRAYLTGGATAVLLGWRESTIDIDVRFVPETERLMRAIPKVKESQRVNVEFASPLDFIPVPEGWEERELFERVEPELYRFPAIDPPSFRRAVDELFGTAP